MIGSKSKRYAEIVTDYLCFSVVLLLLAATVVGLLGWFVLLSAYL
jgi:hypothetical protein